MNNENNEKLNEQRLKNVNCDLVIRIGERSFPAHRKFLRERLRFFRNRIPAFELTKQNSSTIVLKPEVVDPEVFDNILQYAYVKQIKFTTANLEPIYRTADYLHFEDLLDYAEDAMGKVNKTSTKMLVLLMNIARDFELKELEYELKQSLITNPVSALAKQHLIPALNYEHLKVLLKRMGDKKETMYYLCAEWVGKDENNRARKFAELLRILPIGDLSFRFLDKIVSENAVIQGNNECLRLLVSSLKQKTPEAEPKSESKFEFKPEPPSKPKFEFKFQPKSGPKFQFKAEPQPKSEPMFQFKAEPPHKSEPKFQFKTEPRPESQSQNSKPENSLTDTLLIIGGEDTGLVLTISKTLGTFTWTQQKFISGPVSRFGVAVHDGKVYICGGRSWRSAFLSPHCPIQPCLEDLRVLTQTPAGEWSITKASSLKQGREGCSMIEHFNYLYVAGGRDESNRCLSSVERYNLNNETWETIESMTVNRNGLELVKLGFDIYAIGGSDGNRALNTFERYDLATSKWVQMTSRLNHTFAWFGSAVLNNRIYVADGENCEVYNPEIDEWHDISGPTKCVGGMKLAVFGDKLYAIGGRDHLLKSLKRVEWFDVDRHAWRPEPEMDVARCFHGVAVIKNQKNECSIM